MTSASPVNQSKLAAARPCIVGIGASAGGLAALEQFFGHVPPISGLAYVVVQHLDPTQKALLAELLQRVTMLPVRQAQESMRVEADSVYVIPPNTELRVINGFIKLEKPAEPRGMRLPINVLFSSLARDQRERATAVILSGMGSDGTLGMQAVKALGGLTLAQQPDTAQFDSMPRSAISTGCVDIVAPPVEMPARILEYVRRLAKNAAPALRAAPISPRGAATFAPILDLLHHQTKHDFSLYKPSTLLRRIERRMAIHSITLLADYADFLSRNKQEIDLLFKELLIGVTSFFRDPLVWEQLAASTLPDLLARRSEESKLRAWVVGCSTGEEAYSLAMVHDEVTRAHPEYSGRTLQIFASDLSLDAIATARRGRYPMSIGKELSSERLDRFFSLQDGQYRIKQEVRDKLLFAEHDILLDPPFTKLDLLFCRNLMIYFDAELQRRLLPLFHYSMRPGGVLLLGSAETLGRFDTLFAPIDSKLRLYLRRGGVAGFRPDLLTHSFPPLSEFKSKESGVPARTIISDETENLQTAADRHLLQTYAPPAVVVNEAGDIVYISGRTGNYLEPAAGKANWNFHAMVREGLRAPLADALKTASAQTDAVKLRGLRLTIPGGVQLVDVTVQALHERSALQGMVMIVFSDVAAPPSPGRRKSPSAMQAAHEAEIKRYREEIQTLSDDTHASKEELQSANEELQSTNEELQSANEELSSSKEEMQSLNEELQTINAELQSKLDALSVAQGDLKNLLNSTDIAMLFLDDNLNVRRYTDRAAKIINLRESDIGRPLTDLTTNLQYSSLNEDARDTLRTLAFSEKEILASDGRWFLVRIMPYRRLDNVVDGAVITFVDITAAKDLESKLRGGDNP